jgi:hypothetical protein
MCVHRHSCTAFQISAGFPAFAGFSARAPLRARHCARCRAHRRVHRRARLCSRPLPVAPDSAYSFFVLLWACCLLTMSLARKQRGLTCALVCCLCNLRRVSGFCRLRCAPAAAAAPLARSLRLPPSACCSRPAVQLPPT